MFGVVYKITNLANGKIYVGKTSQSMHKRFMQHLRGAFKHRKDISKLHCAIKKYGVDNFVIEKLDEADSLDELNEKEIKWISALHSMNEDVGYNIMPGGEGNETTRGMRWFTNGSSDIYIRLDEGEVPDGFVPGRSAIVDDRHGTMWINNGEIQKHIPKSERANYPTWHDGMLDRGDDWREHVRESKRHVSQESIEKMKISKRNKSEEEIQVWKEKLSEALKGHAPGNKGRVSITNGTSNKFIALDELDEWLEKGWRRGSHQVRSKGIRRN